METEKSSKIINFGTANESKDVLILDDALRFVYDLIDTANRTLDAITEILDGKADKLEIDADKSEEDEERYIEMTCTLKNMTHAFLLTGMARDMVQSEVYGGFCGSTPLPNLTDRIGAIDE